MPEPLRDASRAWLPERARRHPAATALATRADEAIPFRELDHRAANAAASLAALGVSRGDRIAAAADPVPELVALLHAAQWTGAVLVPLSPKLSRAETARLLADARPRLILRGADGTGSLADARPLDDLFRGRLAAEGTPTIDPEATLTLLYTSGTTGRPKGVPLSNRAHLASATASRANLGLRADDRWLCVLPLHHVGGLSILVRSVVDGVPVVLHPGFDTDAVLASIAAERITLLSLVPTMLWRLLEAGLDRPHALRAILVGGAALSPDLCRRAHERGLPVLPTYGLTETASLVVTATPGESLPEGSSGRALPGVTLRIDSPGDDGIGEIVVRGEMCFPGYERMPEATAHTLRAGEVHTGDVGRIDGDGHLFVLDRRDDRIVTGGENVSPAEVEAVLEGHPGVAEAAVVGVPDAEWGRRVVAFVVLRHDATASVDEIRSFARERLASFKVPREIRPIDTLPRTSSGKLRRQLLRERERS